MTKENLLGRVYILKRWIEEERIPSGGSRHVAKYSVRASEASEVIFGVVADLWIPCRSNLHYLLTGLYYEFDWKAEYKVPITEEEAQMLKCIFESQREYSLWKRAFERLKKEGKDKAKEWLMEQTKVLALRNLMRGK